MSGHGQYQPLADGPPVAHGRARIHFRHLLVTTVGMPLCGFLFCVGWSLLYDFESATSTHCLAKNYLPSLSAAIGSFRVQRRVWKTLIALHAAPRFLFGYLYYFYWREALAPAHTARLLLLTAEVFYVSENLGLIGLSFVTSTENFPFHKSAFILFLVCAGFYMLLTCWLSRLPRARPMKRLELHSRRQKLILFIVYCTSLAFALYFYARHNDRCESGIYTLFALNEYVVVLSNIAFHGTAYWDLHDKMFDLRSRTWT